MAHGWLTSEIDRDITIRMTGVVWVEFNDLRALKIQHRMCEYCFLRRRTSGMGAGSFVFPVHNINVPEYPLY